MNCSCVGEFAVWAISENSGASCVQATTQASSLSDSWKVPTSLRPSSVCIRSGCLSLRAAASALASSAMVLLQLQTFSERSSSDISGPVFLFGRPGRRRFRPGLDLRFRCRLGRGFGGGLLRLRRCVLLFLVAEQQVLGLLGHLQHRQGNWPPLGKGFPIRPEPF